MSFFVNITQLLSVEQKSQFESEGQSPTGRNIVQNGNQLKNKLQAQLESIQQIFGYDEIHKLPKNYKVKFYLIELLTNIVDCLFIQSDLQKSKNEVKYCVKFLHKVELILSNSYFLGSLNSQVLRSISQYYLKAGKLMFQLLEVQLATKFYEKAYDSLTKLINSILRQQNCPNVIDFENLKLVEKYLQELVLILFFLSFLYEQQSQYQQMKEALHLALWVQVKVLADEQNQLFHLVYKQYQDCQARYFKYLQEQKEITQVIKSIFPNDQEEENEKGGEMIHELDRLNAKLYHKYGYSDLNKTSFLVIPKDKAQEMKESFYLQKVQEKLLTETSELKVNIDSNVVKFNKPYLSFVNTNDQDDLKVKQLTETGTTDVTKMTASVRGDSNKKKGYIISSLHGTGKSSATLSKQSTKIATQTSSLHEPINRKLTQDPQKFISHLPDTSDRDVMLDYCLKKSTKIRSYQTPQLDREMALKVASSMQNEYFTQAEIIQEAFKQQEIQNSISKEEFNFGKQILKFKQKFPTGDILDQKESIAINQKMMTNDIKEQYESFQGIYNATEKIKSIKKNQVSALTITAPNQQPQKPDNLFRSLIIRHGKKLGLKRAKKDIIKAHEESKHNHIRNPSDMKNYLFQKKEDLKKKDTDIQKDIAETNRNVIKILMDENLKNQEMEERDLKKKKRFYIELDKEQNTYGLTMTSCISQTIIHRNSQLCQTTLYLSARNDTNKKISNFQDLVNIKKKMNHLDNQKPITPNLLLEKLKLRAGSKNISSIE